MVGIIIGLMVAGICWLYAVGTLLGPGLIDTMPDEKEEE